MSGRHRATVTSPTHETPSPFDTLVPSWSAATPRGSRVRIELQVHYAGKWSKWLDVGVWSGDPDTKRHSAYGDTDDPDWTVETDTIVSRHGATAHAYRYRLTLLAAGSCHFPVVSVVSVVVSDSSRLGEPAGVAPLENVWGEELPVPARSQMVYGRGEEWCSPTSLSMVLAYWAAETGKRGLEQSVPDVARGVYDHAYDGWGNWPFNTAYASRVGLQAAVGRLGSVEEAERWISVGIPLVASIAWNNGTEGQELAGAPIPRSDGHLLVLRGISGSGGVVVNDPAALDGVRRVYDREGFSRAWLTNPGSSGGVVYLVRPQGWPTPGDFLGAL